jgi:hypothetical protein
MAAKLDLTGLPLQLSGIIFQLSDASGLPLHWIKFEGQLAGNIRWRDAVLEISLRQQDES